MNINEIRVFEDALNIVRYYWFTCSRETVWANWIPSQAELLLAMRDAWELEGEAIAA